MGRERTESRKARQGGRVWTVGHSTHELADFLALLERHRIEQVADVRRFPASRRHPRFAREPLSAALGGSGIEHRWFEDLGGRRRGRGTESPNQGIQNAGFRAYADHMQAAEFERAFEALDAWRTEGRTALLCAEALWWRCHRRLLADLFVTLGVETVHILPDGRESVHELWDLARTGPEGLTYPPIQTGLGV
ncbi:MAG TPA: DUF488 domain-containing protein [Gemmatimonadota bacterium]|nr:DUF488 domain-containing protein [Gemmatimonadota bacterium]